MKTIKYIPGNEWSSDRLTLEDEFGNRGEVRWPRLREPGMGRINVAPRWEDAEVVLRSSREGDADETAAAAEFALQLAHIAKTLDLAYASDKAEAMEVAERVDREREFRSSVRDKAVQMRCEEVAQFYMQMVRVQREGHSSHASGELHVEVLREGEDDQAIKRQMWLRERNGNRWTFNADGVAKFEVKDGNRYNKITLTPMDELQAAAERELVKEAA